MVPSEEEGAAATTAAMSSMDAAVVPQMKRRLQVTTAATQTADQNAAVAAQCRPCALSALRFDQQESLSSGAEDEAAVLASSAAVDSMASSMTVPQTRRLQMTTAAT